ncbi:cardiac-enriched FHL2-interacting protein [Brienomyrus brachyistius]|uniref:cardiac-enriched FHL2-interacting protein n=1 Tax=Brienomyrus brachyistius TaxID=42636 RepID=UPI0020B3E9FF|nr:cardiac-enriched FHL2-interacting protein [Brienomyrus brachyistius]XP_048843013.1 cardiac-enriched FHL2-interacting protein [Brienomyrus brachyistius]
MSCLERKRRVRHKTSMHRSCKHPDGFGKASCAGSVMDETDREVSSLTDRAFKSLCIGDEAVYIEPVLKSSPTERQRAFMEDVNGTGQKTMQGIIQLGTKGGVGDTSKIATTFQHPVGDLAKLRNERVPQMNNGAIETMWVQNNSKSKVSSQIKAFAASRNDGRVARDAVRPTDHKQVEVTCPSWDKSALISIQRELSEFSSAVCPQNFTMGYIAPGKKPSSNKPSSMDMTATSTKSSKGKGRKSSKHKKLIATNFFLHSEFSPFQIWRECEQVPFENSDILSTSNFPKWYDSSLYKELKAVHEDAHLKECVQRRKPTENAIAALMSSTKKPSKAQEVGKPHHSSKDQQRAEDIERQNLSLEYLNKDLAVGKGCPSPKVIQNGKAIDKTSSSEMATTCVPWRKNRSLVKKAHAANRPCTMPPPQEQQRQGTQSAVLVMSGSIAQLGIAKLLTPTLCDRQEMKTLVSLKDTLPLAKPPPAPSLETEARPHEVRLRDGYKAMASSLLFNIKDNRKRVKNTYNPPKFKSPDSPGPKSILTILELSGTGTGTVAHPKAGDGKPVSSPALEPSEVRTGRRKELAEVCVSDDYLTLSSPPAVKEACGFKSFPGATGKSTGQAQPVDLHAVSSPLTSRDAPQKCLAPDPCTPAGLMGKEIANEPLMENASQQSTEKEEESPEKEPPLSNAVDFSGESEAFGKEATQASNRTIKKGLGEIQDLYLDGCGVGVSGLDAMTGCGNSEGPSAEDRAVHPVTAGEKDNAQPGMDDRKERDSRKEVRVKHVFSAKQNQYIKNERYAMIVDSGEEEGGAEVLIPRADIGVVSHQSVTQEKRNMKVNKEKRGPENDMTLVLDQSEVREHMTAVNGDMHNQNVQANKDTVWVKPHALSSGQGELILNKENEVRREENMTSTRHAQNDWEEQVKDRENSNLKQTFSKKSSMVYDENSTAQALLPPKSVKKQRNLVSAKDEANVVTERRRRPTGKDSFAIDSRGRDGEQKHGRRGTVEKGNVRQKVLSYMSMKECVDGLQTEGAESATRVQSSRKGFTGTDEGSVSQKENAGKTWGDEKRREVASIGEKDEGLSGEWTAKEHARRGQGRSYGKANGKSNGAREMLAMPVQDSWAEGLLAHAREAKKAPVDSYLLPMVDSQDKDFKAQPSQQSEDLQTKGDKNTLGKDSQMMESQYFSVTDPKSEATAKESHAVLLQSDERASWTGESTQSPSEMEEGGWIRCLIESAKAQSQAPLSPVGKPTLFKVKDNTFRNSPIIRTVKLPFHLPCPEEFCLGSPKGSLSGSERGDDEQDRLQDASFPHSIGLTSRTYGASARSATSHTAKSPEVSGEPRRSHQRHVPIPEEEEGASEQVNSCAMIVVGVEEKPASTVPTEDTTCSEEPSERSESACSAAESRPQSNLPVVPPKSEKALRRAQKLNTRRNRKVDSHRRSQGQSQANKTAPKPSQPASSARLPPTESPVPQQPVPDSEPASSSCNVPKLTPPPVVDAILPPCSMTQRKVLQDPDSGQYFVVDMPVQVKTKTFFDPETGMYLQLPVKQSEEASSPVTSGSPPTSVEAPYMLYHGFVPMPVNLLPSQGLACNMSVRVTNGQKNLENGSLYRQMWDKQNNNKNTEPDGIYGTLHDGSLYSEDRDSISSRNVDIMSLGEVDDLAIEN